MNRLGLSYTLRMRLFSRRVVGILASVTTAAALLVAPTGANAQMPNLSSSVGDVAEQMGSSMDNVHNAAWNARMSVHGQTSMIHPQAANAIRGVVDDAIDVAFPGLIQQRIQASRPAPAQAPAPRAAAPSFDYGSCPKDAKACVDIDGRRTWLQNNGQVYYGDVYQSPGRPGQETPRGTFWVNRKVKDEVSWEFNNAPMPYAVYFTYNGHAFHEGSPNSLSAGCVRLNHNDAVKYFNDLNIGDKVYIY